MYFQVILSLFFIIFTLHSCSHSSSTSLNKKKKGHYRLYSRPDMIKPRASEDLKRVVIVSNNNFNGSVSASHFNIPNKKDETRVISVGGIQAIKAYVQVFKLTFPRETLVLDTGSFYDKNKESNRINSYYNYIGFDAISLAESEFMLRSRSSNYLETLGNKLQSLESPVITSNLFDLNQATSAKIKNVYPSIIKEVNGVKVGILSTLSSKTPKRSSLKNFTGLYIQNNIRTIVNKSNELKRKGADIIVLMTNLGIDCATKHAKLNEVPIEKLNFDPNSTATCDTENSELYHTLKKLPPKVVDLVLASGEQTKVANFIAGIPVLRNEGFGKYLSWVELYYEPNKKEISKGHTVLHQPIKLCHQFLKKTQDCYLEEEILNKKVIPATFLDSPIIISPLPTI